MKSLLRSISNDSSEFIRRVKSSFSFEGRKLFDARYIDQKNIDFLKSELASELNLMIETGLLVGDGSGSELSLSDSAMALINESQHKTSFITANRRILEETLFNQIEPYRAIGVPGDQQDSRSSTSCLMEKFNLNLLKSVSTCLCSQKSTMH